MPELIGQHEDILTDLYLLERYAREEEVLSDAEKRRLNRLPKAKREDRKKKILKEKENEKKERLRIRALELEDKVRKSDLPSEITGEIIDMLAYAKDRGMTYIHEAERKIEALKDKVREAEIQKKKEEEEQMKAIQKGTAIFAAVALGAAVAGAVLEEKMEEKAEEKELPPFVHVRYDAEEFAKKRETFYAEKILAKTLKPFEEVFTPRIPERVYKTKKGSMYPKSHYALEEKHKKELLEAFIQNAQKNGSTQTREELTAIYNNMLPKERELTNQELLAQDKVLADRQKLEKKLAERESSDKNLIRFLRRREEKEAYAKREAARKARQAAQLFAQKQKTYYVEKILPKVIKPYEKPATPPVPAPTYTAKKGDAYPQSHYALEEKHKQELLEAFVQDAQRSDSKQTREEIIATYNNMTPAERRVADRVTLKNHKKLAAKQRAEKRQAEQEAQQKSQARLLRRQAKKQDKQARNLDRETRSVAQKPSNSLTKERIQTKDPRIAERSTNDKPKVVKAVSPAANQAKLAPTAVKEEKKGISGRLLKVEQLGNKRGDLKGISAALAAAEQAKIQEAQERVRAESKGKFNADDRVLKPLTPEQQDRIATLIEKKNTTSRGTWKKDKQVNGVEALIRGKDTTSREFWQNALKQRQARKAG